MLRESLSGSLSDLSINKDLPTLENVEKDQFVPADEVFEQKEINENTLENPAKVNEIPISGGKEVDNVIFYFDKFCCSALKQFSGWEHTNLFYRGICSKENWVKIFILNKHCQQTGRKVLDKTQCEILMIFLSQILRQMNFCKLIMSKLISRKFQWVAENSRIIVLHCSVFILYYFVIKSVILPLDKFVFLRWEKKFL